MGAMRLYTGQLNAKPQAEQEGEQWIELILGKQPDEPPSYLVGRSRRQRGTHCPKRAPVRPAIERHVDQKDSKDCEATKDVNDFDALPSGDRTHHAL
jgi:hypothetical protein